MFIFLGNQSVSQIGLAVSEFGNICLLKVSSGLGTDEKVYGNNFFYSKNLKT